jgi:putative endonuclease
MPFVYLLASKPYGTLYVGSTFELARRVWQHKTRAIPGFTTKYGVDRLVWFETHERLETALVRERQIKKWKRDWKINLIERENPHWADLYPILVAVARQVTWVPAGVYPRAGRRPDPWAGTSCGDAASRQPIPESRVSRVVVQVAEIR